MKGFRMRHEKFAGNDPEEVVKKYPNPSGIRENGIMGVKHLYWILKENPAAIKDDGMKRALEHFGMNYSYDELKLLAAENQMDIIHYLHEWNTLGVAPGAKVVK